MAKKTMNELLEEVVSKGKAKFKSDDGVSEVSLPEMDDDEPDTDLDQAGEGMSASEKNKRFSGKVKDKGEKLSESDDDEDEKEVDADDLDDEDEDLKEALREYDSLAEGRMAVVKSEKAKQLAKMISNLRVKIHYFEKAKKSGTRYNKTSSNPETFKKELAVALQQYKAEMAKNHPKSASTNKSMLNNSFDASDFNISEDLNAMFGSDNNLSEEFKSTVTSIYEAALVSKANEIATQISEELTEEFETAKQTFAEELKEEYNAKVDELIGQIDDYLVKTVNEWKEENSVEIESQFKSEISESFMSKLKVLFEEHYIDMPEEKTNILESFENENFKLREKLEKEMARNVALKEQVELFNRNSIVNELSENLTDSQKDKFNLLSETVVFTNTKEYRGKLNEIRSAYFSKNNSIKYDLDDEDPIDLVEEVRTPDNRDETVTQIAESMSKFFGKTRR